MKQFQMVGDFFLLIEESTAYVVAANYKSVLSHDKALKDALIKEGIKGQVQLDMLLKTGTSKNRFGTIYFDGEKFIRSSSKITDITNHIKERTTDFFRKHNNLFVNCTLTERQILHAQGYK